MICCQNLVKKYRDFIAIDRVSFSVSGGICALLGPNGAGKSTLLKLMTGLLSPDVGEINVAGFDAARPSAALKKIIGVLPEDLGLFDSLTVEEHLQFAGPLYGLNKRQVEERMDGLFRLLSLDRARNVF